MNVVTKISAAGTGGLEIRRLSETLGAEIRGIDLGTETDPGKWAALRAALAEHGVIFFRDQDLTPEQHIAMAEKFGDININRFFSTVEGYPQIAEVRKEAHQKSNIGAGWHADHSYDEAPALGSILLAREVPAYGGDTQFADLALAYDHLSDGLKATLKSLRAVHSSRHVFGKDSRRTKDLKDRLGNEELATQDSIHPVVIRHPDSGREVLFVNPGFTIRFDGWTAEESKPLLDYLYRHAQQAEFTYRFHWEKGSIAFWDNRRTWHQALNNYQGMRRIMHRITIEGGKLAAA
ncbi:MAG: TauD/TfdA dioxygenase family protein [Hyphomicrobiaceae bacterium]